ncbi:aspartyl protease family protein [Pontibacter sp. BT310]|uniref:Aspartyl protease family protein n=1 Tax=Pontibacter populi TaxID=890055 RepID=A0ABS6XAR6_9BACT|nr:MULTISPECIES: aspartyl protease family protein [Pontibacter]MBJ6117881.1 aspartyl protease family protein [Pontibacter sp. BT310]MBR0570308.1 aspartyl protease family protein [Microvirga sp. STS03]MBW3364734.1 aspartyl protease family protein [Pontibacter populi]
MAKAFYPVLLCLLSCFLLQPEAKGQTIPQDTAYFTGNAKKIKIPFKLVHNLIVITVKINDSKPLNFILDSGVNSTLITQLNFTDSLSLNNSRKITVQGLGQGFELEALISSGNNMFLRGIEGVNHEVYVLLEDIFNLSTRMGMPVHGIIGYDIFKNFIVKINYNTQVITLYKPDTKLRISKRAEVQELSIEDCKAYVYAKVRQYNGDSLNVKLVVDTGASHSLSLYLPTNDKLKLPPKVMEAYLGRGLSGDIHGKIGRINSMSLGRHQFENLPASYPDEQAIKVALNIANRNGNLGSDILKRFTVIFDYPHNRLVLLPNRKYKQPFSYNIAGFEVSTPMPGYNVYVVSNVSENSAAKEAGIKPGDQLMTINGKHCYDLDLNNILNLLEGKPGHQLKLTLQRNTTPYSVTLTLQNRI